MKRKKNRPVSKAAAKKLKQLPEAFVKRAKAEHKAIASGLQDLRKGWGTLARRCLAFREEKYHRAIQDPATGKPYRKFADWATSVFGRSRSTLYAEMRIVAKLGGAVKKDALDRMPKQNAEALVEYQVKGGKLSPRLVDDAEELPEDQFRKRLGLKSPRVKPRPLSAVPSPFPASEATKRFQRALGIAKWLVREDQRELPVEDKALDLIAGEFLAAHEMEYEMAHAPRKSAAAVSPTTAAAAASVPA